MIQGQVGPRRPARLHREGGRVLPEGGAPVKIKGGHGRWCFCFLTLVSRCPRSLPDLTLPSLDTDLYRLPTAGARRDQGGQGGDAGDGAPGRGERASRGTLCIYVYIICMYISLSLYIHIYIHINTNIYIYIYIERERELYVHI